MTLHSSQNWVFVVLLGVPSVADIVSELTVMPPWPPLLLPNLVDPPIPPCPSAGHDNHGGLLLLGWDVIGLSRSMWNNSGQSGERRNLLWGFWARFLCFQGEIYKKKLPTSLLDVVMSVCGVWSCWSHLVIMREKRVVGRKDRKHLLNDIKSLNQTLDCEKCELINHFGWSLCYV